jgi:hypothetical protein
MRLILLLFFFFSFAAFSQQTTVKGKVIDGLTGEGLPFAKVRFLNSKIGTISDSVGNFFIQTYYATDSVQFSFTGYLTQTKKVKKDQENSFEIKLQVLTNDLAEVVVKAPDELPSTRLHKLVIANKPINNKEKLEAYEYELYNKIQLDLNNIGDKFTDNGLVKRLDVIMDYLDSTAEGKTYLPVILTESISDFYFKNKPKLKKEVVKATRITGIENLQVNQFLGDMYLDINIYDNIYDLFYKSFISPLAPYARNYYRFYLDDSTFIGKNWCYKLRFEPKRSGDLTFQGEMWIHDTTYAIKRMSANISPGANLNYITDFYFEQEFEQVEKEVWMMVEEKLIADIRVVNDSKLYGLFGRKYSSRKDILINKKREEDFYKSDNTVEFLDSAKLRSDAYWNEARHVKLSEQEGNIIEMVDSLQQTRFFKTMKNLAYLATTGYVLLGKIELGSAFSLVAFNPVEELRLGLALRTSNKFSKRLELGGKVAYGFGDERFKYMGKIRYNITPKKRGMMTGFYSYDIEQIGQSASALSMGNTFTTVLNTAPFDKLTFVNKAGLNLEKDIKKDFILFTGVEWKSFTPLGLANYQRIQGFDTISISNIKTTEFTARIRWAKNEEFLSGYFDRTNVACTNPILSFQTIVGVKGILGSQYNYQKFEFQFEHYRQLGVFGRMYYGFAVGYINGRAAYPFLKVHEGNQSLYLMSSAFNKLNFLELISDRYVSGFVENQWGGILFDRIPLIKKLKLRLVTTGKFVLGEVRQRHQAEMLMPSFVKKFNNIPYAETSVGIENILKFGRVDLVWRMTHLDPGVSPLGIRAKLVFNF